MLKKEGYPEAEELVLVTVTNVQFHSVFCKLDEYDKPGMILLAVQSAHNVLGKQRSLCLRKFVKIGRPINAILGDKACGSWWFFDLANGVIAYDPSYYVKHSHLSINY